MAIATLPPRANAQSPFAGSNQPSLDWRCLMCGIAGIVGRIGDPAVLANDVSRMVACLEHRGPDDGGTAAGAGWAVGMRRLAVQDTSNAGHQPMRRGDCTIVFNGEVYNFPELRRELEQAGHAFSSGSDTEVVLNALIEWGPDALARFNGMFALALIDERNGRLLLARDRFGKKPLFVAQTSAGVLFASELKAILAVARAELRLDEDALRDYFRFQYVPGRGAIFENVEKVPAASWWTLDLATGARVAEAEFWTLPEPDRNLPSATPAEVDECVSASVGRRLISDVPVGAFLSGGTDSSLVVACMAKQADDVRTFSLGFDDPRYDESHYALAVARHLGTNHTHEILTAQRARQLLVTLASVFDEPFADSSAVPTLAVSQLARRDVTVALSGDGGDEFFGGYTRYKAARLMSLATKLPSVFAQGRHVASRIPRVGRRVGYGLGLTRGGSLGSAYLELVSLWKTDELAQLMPGESQASRRFVASIDEMLCHPVERLMRCDARTYLVDDILQKVDRASMSVSLEARNPFLDPAVIAVAGRSTSLATAHPGEKRLLRDTLRLHLPSNLVDRPKMGFGVPIGEWLRRELRPLVEDLVLGRTASEYDSQVAADLCRAHLSGAREATPQVWSLVAFELWRDRWLGSSLPRSRGYFA